MSAYPVLLVHGLDDTASLFRKMRAELQRRGLRPVHAMDILPSDGSISFEAMGLQVRAAAQALLQSSGAAKVDIVAYSMGALAVRQFLQRQGGRTCVRRFISLAGPHHGTLMAYLRWNIGCRQMRPGSAWLRDLNADADPWGEVQVFSFWTPLDGMVLPSSGSRLPHARLRTFWVWLHPWMVSDPRVIGAVAETLIAPSFKDMHT